MKRSDTIQQVIYWTAGKVNLIQQVVYSMN